MTTPFVPLTLALAVAGVLVAAPATARPDDAAGSTSVAVRYGDLDLATPAGLRTLTLRVAHAARRVCGDPDPRDLTALLASRSCRSSALAAARAPIALALASTTRSARAAS